MKIGLPKLRLSRKLLVVTLGITVLLGGTSVATLYFGGKELLLQSGESAIGSECTDIQTMVVKTPSNHLWLRKFIRMDKASGLDRVRTALRISGLLAKKHAVDLIHVSVLDGQGPTLRSQMRARAIGAEVLIALNPDNLPEMKSPAMASYYEGPVSDEGRYYGDKVVVDIDEIGAMMTAMRTVEEKPDCAAPTSAADEAAKASEDKKNEKKSDHGAKPEDHGEKPPKDGADEAVHGEQPAKEESFFGGMLSMVGLGGGEDKPAADHLPAAIDSRRHAVVEEPAEAVAEGHDKAVSEQGARPADPVTAGKHPAKDAKAATDDPAPREKIATPAQADGHGEPEPKADPHADGDMPVGD